MEYLTKIIDENGAPITGVSASTALKIRRASDGYILDWNDLTFKNSAWGSKTTTLSEVDATNMAGYYNKSITISAWTDGWYVFDCVYSGVNALPASDCVYVKNGLEFEPSTMDLLTFLGQFWGWDLNHPVTFNPTQITVSGIVINITSTVGGGITLTRAS